MQPDIISVNFTASILICFLTAKTIETHISHSVAPDGTGTGFAKHILISKSVQRNFLYRMDRCWEAIGVFLDGNML